MNILEELCSEDRNINTETKYKYGTYIILRHNTMDIRRIISEFGSIYQSLHLIIRNQLVSKQNIIRSPRCPVEMRVKECINKKHPLMLSTVQQKQKAEKSVILSHHILYGSNWKDKNLNDDTYAVDIAEQLPKELFTVNQARTNILVQPMGLREEQYLDRPTDNTLYHYIKGFANDEAEDTLLTQMVKQSPTGLKFAIQYTYTP